ncbi:MAG: hypothetical protein QM757_26620 [Paludibaculum sp.]
MAVGRGCAVSLYMETTQISAEKTASELSLLLVQSGARQIAQEYTDKKVTGLRWVLAVGGTDQVFAMPVRSEPVFRLLQLNRAPSNREKKKAEDRAQAERVAWRQLLRWTQAQLALIETGMVAAEEVFLPYRITPSGQTLYQVIQVNGLKLLGPAGGAA